MGVKTVKFEIEIEEHLFKELKKIAKRNDEPFEDYIYMLLREELDADRYAIQKLKEEKNI